MHIKKLIPTLQTGLAVMLLSALLPMPYGYYQLMRIIACMVFLFLAWQAREDMQIPMAFLWLGLGLLFQPFIKIALGRTLWNMVDVMVGALLLYEAWRVRRSQA